MTCLPKLACGTQPRKTSLRVLPREKTMPKPSTPETPTSPVILAAAVAALALGAFSHVPGPPAPGRQTVEIKHNTTIRSARLSCHDAPETTLAGAFNPCIAIDYDRGARRSNQEL